jgi:hypothetical protein
LALAARNQDRFGGAVPEEDPPLAIDEVNVVDNAVP